MTSPRVGGVPQKEYLSRGILLGSRTSEWYLWLCTAFKPKSHDETFDDLETKVLVCKETLLKEGPFAFPSSVIHDTLKEATL